MESMRNCEILKSICDKLESWGIDPIRLMKAIGIFLVIAILIVLFVTIPKLFGILLITVICVVIIALIYTILE